MAQSIMDYIFRRLAPDYLDYDTVPVLGSSLPRERTAQAAGYDTTPVVSDEESDDAELETLAQSVPTAPTASVPESRIESPSTAHSSAELLEITGKTNDAPLCMPRHQDATRWLLCYARAAAHASGCSWSQTQIRSGRCGMVPR